MIARVRNHFVSLHPQGTLAQHGILPSLAPTVLDLLGIPLPVQMTAPSLLMRKV